MVWKTIEKIEQIVARIHAHPEYSRGVRKETMYVLQREAANHSLALELEALANGQKPSEVEIKEIRSHICDAWQYVSQYGINLTTVAMLGSLVAPEAHPYNTFRITEVTFGRFTPPSKENIPGLIDNLLWRLNNSGFSPVIKAIEAHIEMVRIHPYEDGNGRSARLLQNIYLQEAGYPPAIIPGSDRELYIGLLERTLTDRYRQTLSIENPSENEVLFHKYIAAKVLSSAEHLEQQLRTRRVYCVMFKGKEEKGVVYSTAKMLRGYGKRRNSHGFCVRVIPPSGRKKHALEILGDVSKQDVLEIMKRCAEKYNFKYDLVSVIE